MTDTRKYIDEQFEKFFEFDTDDKSTVTSTSCKLFAEHLIADLLAAIELQRQAINQAITDMAVSVGMVMLDGGMPTKEQIEKVIEISNPESDIGKLKQALAINPEDFR